MRGFRERLALAVERSLRFGFRRGSIDSGTYIGIRCFNLPFGRILRLVASPRKGLPDSVNRAKRRRF